MVAELFVEFRSGPSFEQEWPVDHRQIGLFVHVQMSLSQKTGSVGRTESRWKIIRFGLEKAESEGRKFNSLIGKRQLDFELPVDNGGFLAQYLFALVEHFFFLIIFFSMDAKLNISQNFYNLRKTIEKFKKFKSDNIFKFFVFKKDLSQLNLELCSKNSILELNDALKFKNSNLSLDKI
ncbi:hypothetical protein BpHYR1_039339 [Brachionus plicatilis]|uniref:Uncharacterized protein n=1 Tax=Brachionus plicatilis TaxID=10195 RepID=A0A3M7SUY0_BRAPC|nr:hypothetical protein BpHYR1_039339 [Brachionus plicatilis]